MLSAVGVGIVVFATTNIDDILVLAAFFAGRTMSAAAIVVGQFIGIAALTAASAIAALFALAIPDGWVGLIGLAPLALGIRGLFRLTHVPMTSSEPRPDAVPGRLPWLTTALVTMANGGDNLSAYIPLFSRDLSHIPIYAGVFAAMTAVWCAVGHNVVHRAGLGKRLRQYGHVALPFVLIAIGLYVLSAAWVLLPISGSRRVP